MPAHVVFGTIEEKIPQDRIPLNIHRLASTAVEGNYALLKIKNRHKHHVCRVNCLKMLLEDGVGHVIDFFAMGQVADDLKLCEIGDTLLCLEFEVEECPGHWSRPYQIIADDTGSSKSSIWVSKPLNSPASSSHKKGTKSTEIIEQKQSPDTAEKKKNQPYNYRALSEVQVNSVVNVYGVVKFAKPVIKGRGSDYYCVIGLTDPSFGNMDEKLVCNLFHRDPENLPKVEEGDVIRMHRVRIQTYQGGKQGQNGPGFQWLAFHGSVDNKTFSSESYTFEDQDKAKVAELLGWWSEQCQNETAAYPNENNFSQKIWCLADVVPKAYFNLVCQVVQVCVLDPDICRLLRVWDGTKCEGQLKEISQGEMNQSLEEDQLLVKASTGLAVDIFLFDNHAQESDNAKPGDYILLTNIHSSVVSGLVELTIHGGGRQFNRGVKVLSAEHKEVETLKAKLDPLVSKVSADSNSCSLTCTSTAHFGQGTPSPAGDKSGSDIVFSAQGESLGFDPRQDNMDDNNAGSAACNHETSKLMGRKDSPSKNKSLRRRMNQNADDTVIESFDGRKKISDGCVPHTNNTQPLLRNPRDNEGTGDDTRNDSESDSTEDSSQSIWLSIYNDSDNDQNVSKSSSSSILQQGHGKPKCKELSPLSSERQLRSAVKSPIKSPPKDGSSVDNCQMNKVNAMQENAAENDMSSRESFVTVPSPNYQKNVGPSDPENVDNNITETLAHLLSLTENSAENQRYAEKRSGEKLKNDCHKRIRASYEENEEERRVSRRMTRQEFAERLERGEIKDNAKNSSSRDKLCERVERERTKSKITEGHDEAESFLQSFSQNHLEILDFGVLCFDTNEFSEVSKTVSKDGNPTETAVVIPDTELPIQKVIELKKKCLRPKSMRSAAKRSEDVQQQSSCISQQEMENSNNVETRSTHQDEDSETNRWGHSNQESQEFLQVGTADSQVSSSTDSPNNSLSQSRCMLKTASVVVDHHNVPLSTLREVLEHPPPYKFRIQARVEKFESRPSAPEDLVHFLCSQCKFFRRIDTSKSDSIVTNGEPVKCPKCVQPPSTLRPVTVLVLQLSDEHETVSASVWDKNADQFFGGITPQQLLNDHSCFQQVQQWLTELCPLGSSLESRPVLECCVCSYYVDGNIKIQVFDTILV